MEIDKECNTTRLKETGEKLGRLHAELNLILNKKERQIDTTALSKKIDEICAAVSIDKIQEFN